MVDRSPLGHVSATGQLKKTFLEGWPDASFLQVWLDGESLRLLHPRQEIGRSRTISYDLDEIVRRCIEFQPDVVYFRRSEEHTSELQSLMRISYAVFCLQKKIKKILTLQ